MLTVDNCLIVCREHSISNKNNQKWGQSTQYCKKETFEEKIVKEHSFISLQTMKSTQKIGPVCAEQIGQFGKTTIHLYLMEAVNFVLDGYGNDTINLW